MTAFPQPQTETKPGPPSNVTRVDLTLFDGTLRGASDLKGVRVMKWEAFPGWDGHEELQRIWGKPDHIGLNTSKSLDEMADWLEAHGYRIYRWPTGARAFWGTPKPVRTSHQMVKLRQRLERQKAAGYPPLQDIQIHTLDLKFEW